MNKKCLIIDKMHESILPLLKDIGIEGHYRPDIVREELLNIIANYEGLIVRSKTAIDTELIAKARQLQFVARAGAGMDQLDTEVLAQRDIHIINAPEGNQDALAEHAVGMLLCLLNKIHLADRQVREGIWDRESNRGVELKGKTVGLIGYGFMGAAFAARLSAFGCRILAYDKYKSGFTTQHVTESRIEDLYDQTDILSLHIPLTAETRSMIDLPFLNLFKKNIYLINTSKGEIAPLKDLKACIESGKIAGAALDVLENENFNALTSEEQEVFHSMAQSSKVLFTPHVAGWTYESYLKINQVLVTKIKKLFHLGSKYE